MFDKYINFTEESYQEMLHKLPGYATEIYKTLRKVISKNENKADLAYQLGRWGYILMSLDRHLGGVESTTFFDAYIAKENPTKRALSLPEDLTTIESIKGHIAYIIKHVPATVHEVSSYADWWYIIMRAAGININTLVYLFNKGVNENFSNAIDFMEAYYG